ncbi:MAG: hypothetical protein ACRDI1_08945 [Actinomycetota bacterium]
MLIRVAAKKKSSPRPRPKAGSEFTRALSSLLKSKGIRVPSGLSRAPAEAYMGEPASFVDSLADLPDSDLARYAERISSYAARQEKRVRSAWESSPLITELRRRKLKEPPAPKRVVALAFSVKTPLQEWTNAEILQAARQWSARGS